MEHGFPAGRDFHHMRLTVHCHAHADALPFLARAAGPRRIGGHERGGFAQGVFVPGAAAAAEGDGAGKARHLEVNVAFAEESGIGFVVELVAAYGEPAVVVPELAAHVGKPKVVHVGGGEAGEHGPEAAGVFLFRELAAAAGRGNFGDVELFGKGELFLAAAPGR